jgi:hypothetical protein
MIYIKTNLAQLKSIDVEIIVRTRFENVEDVIFYFAFQAVKILYLDVYGC